MKFGRPFFYHSLLHGTIQFEVLQKLCATRYNSIWSVAKAPCPTWALILFGNKKIYISNDILKVKLKKIPTYNPYEIW